MLKPTSPVDQSAIRIVLITMDRHLGATVAQAQEIVARQLPRAQIALHVATDWEHSPEALAAAREDIASGDIIIANMLFLEDHIQAVLPQLQARRDHCDAMVGMVAAGDVIKLTRLGRFDMSVPASGAMALLKKLRGTSGKKGAKGGQTSGAGQMAMLRRLPKILRYIPGKAQDVRAYFLSMQYWLAGSEQNIANLALYLVNRYASGPRSAARGALEVADPVVFPDVGVYHPRMPGRISSDAGDLPAPAGLSAGAAPRGTVGLVLMRSYLLSRDTGHYDAVIAAFEARGMAVVPIFAGALDSRPAVDAYFRRPDGSRCVDAIISLTGFSLVGGPAYNDAAAASATLAGLDVPYIAAHALEFQSMEQWRTSGAGLMPVEATMMVAIPEIEGATVPTVYAARSSSVDGSCRGCARACPSPAGRSVMLDAAMAEGPAIRGGLAMRACPERVDALVAKAEKLVALRSTPRTERRVAIVLFNFPPNAGATGTAAFLDVFASLHNTLLRLKAEGYALDVPASVDDLRDALLKGNAERYGTDANVIAHVSNDDHVAATPWLEEIEAQWGASPGRLDSDGRGLFIQGLELGNVLIAVQPGFGYEGDPMRLLFEGGFAPTHAFSNFYRFLRDGFGAHGLLHFGTHGALEFMPGKQTGLDAESWPERLIADLPNYYLYAGNNPSEATIAKRRSGATLISYLTPPVVQAGLYKGLADLKASLERWRTTPLSQCGEREGIAELIVEQARTVDLIEQPDADAGEPVHADERIAALSDAVLELEYALIPHGLHIVGGRMARAERISLLEAIADAQSQFPSQPSSQTQSHPSVQSPGAQAHIDPTTRALPPEAIAALADGARAETVGALLRSAIGSTPTAEEKRLVATLANVAEHLDCAGELDGIVHALDGGYIAPVAGGDLLRSPDVVPSGRNIHAFDPFRLPSAYAMRDGDGQAQRLLERTIADTGALPETVALVLWGTDNIKSEGGPIAQALALMGARPRFDAYGRLCGADLVPLEEMERPRIDVMVTLSGIFRDLLPFQTQMLAEAAYLAACADEPVEKNYIRKHALDECARSGVDLETAALRVFSNAQGAYGSNVNMMVSSGAWSDEDELADVFAARKSFAYGRRGAPVQRCEHMQAMLATVDVAYQNLESVELGVTTIDHYFDTLGGIGRSVAKARGGAPAPVYIGDQTTGAGKVRSLSEQVALETRTRALNPKWYEALLSHGYEGVRQIEAQVTNTMGWSATTGEVQPWVYQQLSQTFVLDPEMRDRISRLNPKASVAMANRLIEAHERNYWSPDAQTLEALRAAGDELEDRLEGLEMESAA